MNKKNLTSLQLLLSRIFTSKENIYKTKYQKAGIERKDVVSLNNEIFTTLPTITLKELAKAPYKTRLLEEKAGFHKLIHSPQTDSYFIIHRTLAEIKKDITPILGKRPLVLMDSVHEAIERCLFFYEKQILPLIGETSNPAIVYETAKQYNVDSLIIDHQSLVTFKNELLQQNLPIKSVTILDTNLTPEDLTWPKEIKVYPIISLPEFGPVAYQCSQSSQKKKFIFHAYDDVFIEPDISSVLTSSRLSACPMIRYKSDVAMKETAKTCMCREKSLQFLD